jgi:hypothetical protein
LQQKIPKTNKSIKDIKAENKPRIHHRWQPNYRQRSAKAKEVGGEQQHQHQIDPSFLVRFFFSCSFS